MKEKERILKARKQATLDKISAHFALSHFFGRVGLKGKA